MHKMTTVVSLKTYKGPCVRIGRPSKWGNPFHVGRDGTRKQVIEAYRQYLYRSPELMRAARKELKGQVLGCFCKPLACHGDVLADIADMSDSEFESLEERLSIQMADNLPILGR
jgi:hypothetical protein